MANQSKESKDQKIIDGKSDQELEAAIAKAVLTPSCNATEAIVALNKKVPISGTGKVGVNPQLAYECLEKVNKQFKEGDLSVVEEMLLNQALTLQAINTTYVMKLPACNDLHQLEVYSRIALKAQNQSRQTLATLIELKNPRRTQFIKQQNNAQNQQINNGEPVNIADQENSKDSENPANKLLEEESHERLDTGTQAETVTVNSELETMGEIDRSKKRRRKAKS